MSAHTSLTLRRPSGNQANTGTCSDAIEPVALEAASERQLRSLQRVARLGSTWGILEIPEELKSTARTLSLNLWEHLPPYCLNDVRLQKNVVREVMRLAIAMALFAGRQGTYYKRSTLINSVAGIYRIVRRTPEFGSRGKFWQCIDVTRESSSARRALMSVLRYYHGIGCLPDAPTNGPCIRGAEGPRDRTGEPEHENAIHNVQQIQPYPDQFVSEAGWASMLMIETVGPTLLDALEAALAIPIRTEKIRGTGALKSSVGRAAEARDPIVKEWKWRGPDGTDLSQVPIGLCFKQGRSKDAPSWPPRTFKNLLRMVTILQGAHAFPVALCAGPRHGELLSMKVGALSRRGESDVYEFRTWKMEGEGGRLSEAPVPSLAVRAILQQERLCRILRNHHGVGGSNLWVSLKAPNECPDILSTFRQFVWSLGLKNQLGVGGMNPHRFRKTLARIVALALVHAPKILMDVFGHRDEQMTVMRYILSDPKILSEVQQVVREMVILKGVEAVEKSAQLQGAGAENLRRSVEQYAQLLGSSALEPQNMLEFARAMTAEGSSWAIVAPGIVCTNFTSGGLCNKGQGQANPHYCHPKCSNQLTFPGQAEDLAGGVARAISTINYNLELLQQAVQGEETMLIAQFQGQIRSLLGRWEEVDRYFAHNQLLKQMIPGMVLIT